jgi:hypothetical protein
LSTLNMQALWNVLQGILEKDAFSAYNILSLQAL